MSALDDPELQDAIAKHDIARIGKFKSQLSDEEQDSVISQLNGEKRSLASNFDAGKMKDKAEGLGTPFLDKIQNVHPLDYLHEQALKSPLIQSVEKATQPLNAPLLKATEFLQPAANVAQETMFGPGQRYLATEQQGLAALDRLNQEYPILGKPIRDPNEPINLGASLMKGLHGEMPQTQDIVPPDIMKEHPTLSKIATVAQSLYSPTLSGLGTLGRTSLAASPEIEELGSTAKAAGIPLTPAEITKRKPQQILQSLMDVNPYTSTEANNIGLQAREGIQNMAENVQQGIGETNPQALGETVKEGLSQAYKAHRAESKRLFDNLSDISQGKQGVLDNFYKTINQHLDSGDVTAQELSKKLNLPEASLEQRISSPEMGTSEKIVSFDKMRDLRGKLSNLIKSRDIVSPEKEGVWKNLHGALTQDINEFANQHGGEVLDAFNAANKFYGPSKQALNSPLTRAVSQMTETSPELVASKVIQPKKATEIASFKNMIGEKHFEPIKQQFTQNLIDSAKTQAEGQTESFLVGSRLLKTMKNYGPDVLKQVYSPEELSQLDKLSKISSLSLSAAQTLKPGAGASPMGVIRMLGRYGLGLPLKGIQKVYNSPLGEHLLTTEPALGRGLRAGINYSTQQLGNPNNQ